jgi:hypothetical protein
MVSSRREYALASRISCRSVSAFVAKTASWPEAIGSLLERGLELVQGSCRLPHFKQHFRQQFAERIKAILHRHML